MTSKWRISSKSSKRPSEAANSEIRFNPLPDPNRIPPERMSSLVGYTINPAFSDVFTGSKTNEAILTTIAETNLTKSQRKPRKPSVNDEAALYQAIRHLSEMGTKDEYALTVQELNAWRTAVNIAYMTFTEDGVVPLASLASSSSSSTTQMLTLSKSKSFSIPRKPVPSTTIPEMPSELSKSVASRPYKAPRKYSLPASGHNPLIDSPKLRSGLPIGQLHALEVDKVTSFGPNAEWTRVKAEDETLNSLYQQTTHCTPDTATFDMSEWSMITPKANITKHSTNVYKDDENNNTFKGFTKEQCESSKLKRFPDVSGERGEMMEKTYTYSDYGDENESVDNNHSNATSSNHSSPRTEEVHLQQLSLSTNCGENNQEEEILRNSPMETRKSIVQHHHQLPSPNSADKVENNKIKPSPPSCRIRVPPSVKRSIQDQRWTPGSHNRLSIQDDSDEDDDDDFFTYSTTKKPIRKPTQSKKNDMLGMLDFLSSGPPE